VRDRSTDRFSFMKGIASLDNAIIIGTSISTAGFDRTSQTSRSQVSVCVAAATASSFVVAFIPPSIRMLESLRN